MLRKVITVNILLFLYAVNTLAFPSGFEFKTDGTVRLDNLKGYLAVYDKNGTESTQDSADIKSRPAYPIMSVKASEAQGDWSLYPGHEPFWYLCKFREATPDSVSYQARFLCKDGNKIESICFVLELPGKEFNGKYIEIDSKKVFLSNKETVKSEINNAQTITFMRNSSKISIKGKFDCQVGYSNKSGKYLVKLSKPGLPGLFI